MNNLVSVHLILKCKKTYIKISDRQKKNSNQKNGEINNGRGRETLLKREEKKILQ